MDILIDKKVTKYLKKEKNLHNNISILNFLRSLTNADDITSLIQSNKVAKIDSPNNTLYRFRINKNLRLVFAYLKEDNKIVVLDITDHDNMISKIQN